MTYTDLKKVMDPSIRSARFNKAEFIEFAGFCDGRVRIGGPKGKGRITAKRALALLGQ